MKPFLSQVADFLQGQDSPTSIDCTTMLSLICDDWAKNEPECLAEVPALVRGRAAKDRQASLPTARP